MLQLLYVSSSRLGQAVDLDDLLVQCRRNNARDAVTGILFTDGRRFLQALEGDVDVVDAAFARIAADPRHHALVVLSRRQIIEREFGGWDMALRLENETHDRFAARVAVLCAAADPSVRGTFAGLITARRGLSEAGFSAH